MFQTLADEEVNIQMISTSEIKISCIIDEAQSKRALKAIHKAFDLSKK
jgi:aspartate kinase